MVEVSSFWGAGIESRIFGGPGEVVGHLCHLGGGSLVSCGEIDIFLAPLSDPWVWVNYNNLT